MTPQHEELKLRLVEKILAAIVSQDDTRRMAERMPDIDHSFDVANEVLRRIKGEGSPAGECTLEPKPPIKTRETLVQRDAPPLREALADRRAQQTPTKKPGPTLH